MGSKHEVIPPPSQALLGWGSVGDAGQRRVPSKGISIQRPGAAGACPVQERVAGELCQLSLQTPCENTELLQLHLWQEHL